MNRALALKLAVENRLLAVTNLARSIAFLRLDSRQRSALKRSEERWSGSARGKSCIICGNGPSIDELDFSKFSDVPTFTANYFYKHAQGAALSPDFHVIVDGKIASGIWPITMVDEVLVRLPKAALFLNVLWLNLERFAPYRDNQRIFWILPILFPHAYTRPRLRLDRPISGLNVVHAAVSLATAMGYREIGIAGMDGDGLFREIIDKQSHFYEGAKDHSMRSFDSMIESLMLSTMGLWGWRGLVNTHAARGIHLRNLCKGGIMDCIPRILQSDFLRIDSQEPGQSGIPLPARSPVF